jgi:hypothetical protein
MEVIMPMVGIVAALITLAVYIVDVASDKKND